MKPQPPVTRIRTAPDTSSAAKVKHHTTGATLWLSGLKVGLLINFGAAHLKDAIKRVINGQLESAEISDLAL